MKLEEILKKYSKEKSNLIQILNEIQELKGYIPLEDQKSISEYLDLTLAEIYSVVTFYSRFTIKPKGKYNFSICTGTACHVKGAGTLLEYLEEKLGIKTGDVTEDGLFGIVENRCVGACSLAPVLTLNDKVYGNCTKEKIDELIDSLK